MAATAIAGGLLAFGAYQQFEAMDDAKKAARAQKRSNEIARAQGQVQDINARRQQQRKARIRRAQILQASRNLGVSGSSGEIGAQSALATNIAAANASIRGSASSANAISLFNQRAADSTTRSMEHQALGNLAFNFASMAAPSPTGG